MLFQSAFFHSTLFKDITILHIDFKHVIEIQFLIDNERHDGSSFIAPSISLQNTF